MQDKPIKNDKRLHDCTHVERGAIHVYTRNK